MNKEELYEVIKQKISISDKELNEIYDVLKKQMEERGKTTEEAILNRMNVYLLPAFSSNTTKHIGIYLGIEDNFIFNRKTDAVKSDSMKMYHENKQNAIDTNYVRVFEEKIKEIEFTDETDDIGREKKDGKIIIEKKVIPLWHNVDGVVVQDFQLGKPITKLDYSATSYLLVEKEDKTLELKSLNLRGERRDFVMKNNKLMQFKKVQFSAIDKDNKPMNDSKYLNMQIIVNEEVDILQLLFKYAKKQCINLSDLIKVYQKNTDKFIKTKSGYMSNIPFFIRGTVGRIFINEFGENNNVEVRDLNYEKQFSVFLPKDLEIPSEGTPNVIFGGRLRFSEKDINRPFGMNGFMYYVSKESRNLVMPKIINKYVITEEIVEDTIPQQSLLEAKTKKEVEEEW